MSKTICITMTATNRIGLVSHTVRSFWENLFRGSGVQLRVAINIDPAGPGKDSDRWRILDLFRDIMGVADPEHVRYNLPSHSHFPKAFKFVWDKAIHFNPDYVFHLEDDWVLHRPVSLEKLLDLFTTYPDLGILRLSAFRSNVDAMKTWNKFTYWNGDFFEIPTVDRGLLGFAGHPSIIRPEFVRLATECLKDTANPEKQLKGRNKHLTAYFQSHRFGVYNERNNGPLIQDIGRRWMVENGYKKAGIKATFINWEEK